jgi:P4 family phage/plasmid primase-like protien
MNQNIFELASNLTKEELKEFMAQNGAEFGAGGYATDKDMCYCPFHEHTHSTPSVGISYRQGKAFFNCFACQAAGDAIKYAELYYRIKPIDAAKKVLAFLNIPYEDDISEEAKSKAEAAVKERKEKALQAKKRFEAEEKKQREYWQKRVKARVPVLKENFVTMWEAIGSNISVMFPNFIDSIYREYSNFYLGWDAEHESAVIVNQYKNEIHNIKTREKYVTEDKKITDKRMHGKWIGLPHAKAHPFPLEWFEEHPDKRVVICEGEKDALNLLFLGVNCLTLGAATNSWEEYADIVKGRNVYVWFDHDKAGYTGAIDRYKELEKTADNIYIVLFYMFKDKYPEKFDISDYMSKHRLKTPDDFFEAITYSTFKLTNDRLVEIEEIYDIDLSHFKEGITLKDFRHIKKELLAQDSEGKYINVVKIKGEQDDGKIEYILEQLERAKKTPTWQAALKAFAKFAAEKIKHDESETLTAISGGLEFKRTMLTQYRQTHLTDCRKAFEAMIRKAGFDIGEFKGWIYFWTGTHYIKLESNTLKKFIQRDWMEAAKVDIKKQTAAMSEDIVENIKTNSINLDELKKYETRRIVNCLNGTIFISTRGKKTFTPKHDKKNGAINILPFEFDKDASAPKWEKFLRQILPGEKDRMALMEFIGYCFLPTHEFETFLFLYGKSGANGKSVILDTIKSFFGQENVSALQLQQLEGHQLDAIAGKLLNIGSEIDKMGTDKGQWAILKALVSNGDSITVNPKNKDPYELNDKPKLIFSGNEKPKSGLDNGVFRRMLLLSFDKEVKDDEKIRDLSERFKDEMAGIFNLAMQGLSRLKSNGRFTKSERMLEELEMYKDEVNPLRSFIKEALVANKYCCVPSEYLYKLYVAYIKNRGGNPMGNISFFRSLREELNMAGIKVENKQIRLKQVMAGLNIKPKCVAGIMLSSDFEIDAISIGDTVINMKDMNISSMTIESEKSEDE